MPTLGKGVLLQIYAVVLVHGFMRVSEGTDGPPSSYTFGNLELYKNLVAPVGAPYDVKGKKVSPHIDAMGEGKYET